MSPLLITRDKIKHFHSLRTRKYRHKHQQFVAEGATIVSEILTAQAPSLRLLVGTKDFISMLSEESLSRLDGKILQCDERTLKRISSLDSPANVLAILDMPRDVHTSETVTGLALYLDGIRDPGNLGTILRIADWFGLPTVFLTEDCVDVYNSKTIQASMGAFLRVQTSTVSLSTLRREQPTLHIVGANVSGGTDAFQFVWEPNVLLVIGSESNGIRREHHSLISTWLNIPRGGGTSGAESLNAAVATGILCSTYLSQSRAQRST